MDNDHLIPKAHYMEDSDAEDTFNFFRTYRAYPANDVLGKDRREGFIAQIFDIKTYPKPS